MDKKEPLMTDAKRDQSKRLCREAHDDKSGELFTQKGAQHL